MELSEIYFVETRERDLAVLLCRWVEYFHGQGGRIQVYAGSVAAAKVLDQALWTFNDQSFIPHRILTAPPGNPPVEPVVITTEQMPLEGFPLVVCESVPSPQFLETRELAVHFIVLDDPARLDASRDFWKKSRDRGITARHVRERDNSPPGPGERGGR